MAIKTAAALTAENNANFADNSIGAITPALLRAFEQDIIDSTVGLPNALISMKVLVDFNAGNTDTQIPITLPAGVTRYRVLFAIISGASQTLTTATAGLFTQAAGAGVAVITAATAITVATAAENTNNNSQVMNINNLSTECYNVATLFWRVATAQGVAATGTVTLTIQPLS